MHCIGPELGGAIVVARVSVAFALPREYSRDGICASLERLVSQSIEVRGRHVLFPAILGGGEHEAEVRVTHGFLWWWMQAAFVLGVVIGTEHGTALRTCKNICVMHRKLPLDQHLPKRSQPSQNCDLIDGLTENNHSN